MDSYLMVGVFCALLVLLGGGIPLFIWLRNNRKREIQTIEQLPQQIRDALSDRRNVQCISSAEVQQEKDRGRKDMFRIFIAGTVFFLVVGILRYINDLDNLIILICWGVTMVFGMFGYAALLIRMRDPEKLVRIPVYVAMQGGLNQRTGILLLYYDPVAQKYKTKPKSVNVVNGVRVQPGTAVYLIAKQGRRCLTVL